MIRAFTAILIIFLFVISACSPTSTAGVAAAFSENPPAAEFSQTSPATQKQIPPNAPTRTPISTDTSALASTPTPTATRFPGLQSTGPYIVADDGQYQIRSATWFDLHSSNSWTVTFPNEDGHDLPRPTSQSMGLSLDWKWYAYITGSVDESGTYPGGGVVLHLMNLLTGEVQDIADLVPQDYYTRLERLVKQTDPENCQSYPKRCLPSAVSTLNYGLHSLDWSPDGKYLAFGAMIDGDSSDVYTYDIDTGKIRRVESGKWNAENLFWSPDGQRILFEQINYYADDHGSWLMRDTLWTIRRDGTELKKLPKPLDVEYWFSDYEYLAFAVWNAPGGYGNPTAVNIQTGYAYTGCVGYTGMGPDSAAVDPRSRLMAVISNVKCEKGNGEMGERSLYIGPVYGPLHRISDPSGLIQQYDLKTVVIRAGAVHPFVAGGVGIGLDGTLDPTYNEGYPNLSQNYWSASTLRDGFQIFDPSEKLRYEIENSESFIYPLIITWDTNSQGLFIQTDDTIYYWVFNEQLPRWIGAYTINSGYTKLYLANIFNIESLPHLRVLPTRAAKPAEGASIWSQTAYKELFQPGTNRYGVTIPADSSWRWSFSLGTTDPKLFEKIILPEDVEFLINGEKIDSNMFRMSDQTAEGRFSRSWATMLSGWRSGDKAELEIHYTLREAVRDGNVEYPAGEYRQIISLVVE